MKRRLSPVPAEASVYHCMTHLVDGVRPFSDLDKEVFCSIMRKSARFHGVQLLDFCVLSNHYHLLVRIPSAEQRAGVSQEALLSCYDALYEESSSPGYPPGWMMRRILAAGDALSEAWKSRLLRRYGNLSEFMKTLNQRVSIYYNKSYGRRGTLWSGPYHSVFVQDDPRCVSRVAAYIDLNPVRAAMVSDPKDYRWSGYGELMAGCERARVALVEMMRSADWKEAAADYRMVLYAKGAHGREREQGGIDPVNIRAILQAGGKVSAAELCHCKVRYMTAGAVLGTKEFVRTVGQAWRAAEGKPPPTKAPFRLPMGTQHGEEGIYVLRHLVKDRFG